MRAAQYLRAFAIVLASGTGTRFGGPKQLALWKGKSLLEHTLDALSEVEEVDCVVVATSSLEVAAHAQNYTPRRQTVLIAEGGNHRLDSFRKGLLHLRRERSPQSSDTVLMVDANRPLTPPEIYRQCVELSQSRPVVCPAVPLSDGVALVEEGRVREIPTRSALLSLQTPEAAQLAAIDRLPPQIWKDTSILGLCEAFLRVGMQPATFKGSPLGAKVTFSHDLSVLEGLARHKGLLLSGQLKNAGQKRGELDG